MKPTEEIHLNTKLSPIIILSHTYIEIENIENLDIFENISIDMIDTCYGFGCYDDDQALIALK